MTTELHDLLAHVGYEPRSQQTKLFELLTNVDQKGVIAQAGTGTGKSIAVLAAAAHARRKTGIQSLIVTPTRILQDQYMAKDAPAAAACFDLSITELRGRRWYQCDQSAPLLSEQSDRGCLGKDSGCSLASWAGHEGDDPFDVHSQHPDSLTPAYRCEYQEAKARAAWADIVVTNTDFWIINDRTLPSPVFDLRGAVFVDEAHQLEAKLKDYAGRAVRAKELGTHYDASGVHLARALEQFQDGHSGKITDDVIPLIQKCVFRKPNARDNGTFSDRALEIQEALEQMLHRATTTNDNCIVWSDGFSMRMDWVDISASANGLLTARPFGLVSATIPGSMPAALGVRDALVADVGHPFDYSKQGVIRISDVDGSYRYSKSPANLKARVAELREELAKVDGGALLLFSSFKDLDAVYTALSPELKRDGRLVLRQNDPDNPEQTNDEIGEKFKADGRAILFGSESFATGFDVPGSALEFVGIWKLPYPGKDPVTDALAKRFYPRYKDLMLTRVVQGVGRLIRTESDRGRVFIADSRADDLLKSKDLMVKHLGQFAKA
jgi:Rad3-related DNA helicase